jgi:hypothetical protein
MGRCEEESEGEVSTVRESQYFLLTNNVRDDEEGRRR